MIYSNIEDATIGMKMCFDEGLDLTIINLGDEINVFDFLPL
jgi:hypothetical protein